MVAIVLAVGSGHTEVQAGVGLGSAAVAALVLAALVLAALVVHSRGRDCSVAAS